MSNLKVVPSTLFSIYAYVGDSQCATTETAKDYPLAPVPAKDCDSNVSLYLFTWS